MGLRPVVKPAKSLNPAGVPVSDSFLVVLSGPSWQHRRVEPLEFDAGISGGKAPIDAGLLEVAVMHPRSDLANKCVPVGNAAVQALVADVRGYDTIRLHTNASVPARRPSGEPCRPPRSTTAGGTRKTTRKPSTSSWQSRG